MSSQRMTTPRLNVHPALAWSIGLAVLVLVFMGRALFPPPGFGLLGYDARAQLFPWWLYLRDALAEGTIPLWNPCLSIKTRLTYSLE